MIQVTFTYDPETNTISDVKAVGAEVKASKPTAKKVSSKKSSDKVQLVGSSLKLNQDVLDTLQVKVGDKLSIRFNPYPVLVRPDISGEINGGLLITKSLTVSARGKTGEAIAKYGTEFGYVLESDGFLKLTTDAAEATDVVLDTPQENEINNVTLDDSDFTSPLLEGTEVDFDFNI